MSFNNSLTFGLSKSTPTTSTTNTTTTSAPASSSNTRSETSNPGSADSALSRLPFTQNILAKTTSTVETSPRFDTGSSGIAPTVVTIGYDSTDRHNSPHSSSNKADLIDLFERFDVNREEPESEKNQSHENQSHENQENHEDSSVEGEKHETQSQIEESNENSRDMVEKFPNAHSIPKTNGQKDQDQGSDNVSDQQELAQYNEGSSNQDNLEDYEDEKDSIDNKDVGGSIAIPQTKPKDFGVLSNGSSYSENTYNEKEDKKDLSDITGGASYETSNMEEYNIAEPKESQSEQIGERAQDKPVESVNVKATGKVDANQQYQQSHKPFDFQIFLSQLKKRSADPIVRYIRSFLVSFSRQGHTFSFEQRIKIIREFKSFMTEKFSMYEPFSSMDEIDLENSREGLEKLIMNRVYEHCFPPELQKQSAYQIPEQFIADLENDEKFSLQLEKFSWVNGSHLDIDLDTLSKSRKEDLNFIELSVVELSKINKYRAPRDKIICILNACKLIFGFLKVANQETNADSFVPLLILILIKAKTEHLISNLHYIENFRGEEWLLHGETSYYLSTLQGAISFIQNLSKRELTISDDEFNAHMEAWDAQEFQKSKFPKDEIRHPQPQHPNQLNPTQNTHSTNLSPSNVLMTSAEMLTRSISSFLSPSPQEAPVDVAAPAGPPPENPPSRDITAQEAELIQKEIEERENKHMEEAFTNLREVFPDLDEGILKDIIYMNKGNMEQCIDSCLQLTSDV